MRRFRALAGGGRCCSSVVARVLRPAPRLPSAPQGPAAQRIDGLWWFMFWIALGVAAVVIGMLLFGLFRKRKPDEPIDRGGGEKAVVILGIVAPRSS